MTRALAIAYVRVIEWLCESLGHPGACWLCNHGPTGWLHNRTYLYAYHPTETRQAKLVAYYPPAKIAGPGTYATGGTNVFEVRW